LNNYFKRVYRILKYGSKLDKTLTNEILRFSKIFDFFESKIVKKIQTFGGFGVEIPIYVFFNTVKGKDFFYEVQF
jgi:hypothetical protein